MLFDHEFHEKLLSFVRNTASILVFGGFAILIIYRIATKEDLSLITANFIGYTMLLWSFYLGLSNIFILRYDFIKYLKRQYASFFSFNQDIEHISSTSKISYRIINIQNLTLCYMLFATQLFVAQVWRLSCFIFQALSLFLHNNLKFLGLN